LYLTAGLVIGLGTLIFSRHPLRM